jgi:hypothetical protein
MSWAFVVIIIRTKVPSKPVTTELLSDMTLEARTDLRAAFMCVQVLPWNAIGDHTSEQGSIEAQSLMEILRDAQTDVA